MDRVAIRKVTAVLIFLMPVVSSLGSVITIAGLAAARPLAMMLVVTALLSMVRWNDVATFVCLLACVWLSWGLVGLSASDGVKKLFSIGIGLATTLAFVIYPWTRSRLLLLARAWLYAWVIAVVPALYELLTGRHLPNYLLSSPEWTRLTSTDIASYFVNPNPFAYFLCASMIVFVMGARLERTTMRRVLLVCCFITPLLVIPTASRAVLAVSILVAFWALITLPRVQDYWRQIMAAILMLCGVVGLALILSPSLVDEIVVSFQGSGSDRLKLYLNAIWMFLSSFGLGIGPGMFEEAMRSGVVPYATKSAVNPHSGVFEVLSQYGFLVSALLGAALVVLVVKGMRGFRKSIADEGKRTILQGVAVTAITLPLLSFGDSTFLDSPIAWVQIATTLAFYQAQKTLEPPEVPEPKLSYRLRYRTRVLQRMLANRASDTRRLAPTE